MPGGVERKATKLPKKAMPDKPPVQKVDVVILGAGAAGMMCAIEAGKRGRRVVLLDHAERVGKKILISGGGRCNFTNIHTRPENFLSENSHFAKSAQSKRPPESSGGRLTSILAYFEKSTTGAAEFAGFPL